MNTRYFGDTLDILRCYIRDESAGPIYLDSINSNATYNVLFKEHNGAEAAAQAVQIEDCHFRVTKMGNEHLHISQNGI